jgi:prohibitin 2
MAYNDNQAGRSLAAAGIGCASIVVIGILIILFSLRIVGPGEIGIVKTGGRVDTNERGPGFNFVVPFVDDIVNMDGRVQGVPFENLAAASKEYQDVFLTGTLNVHVQFDKAAELYQTVGPDYKDKLVVPYYANIVKEIVPQFGVAEVLPKREEIRRLTVEKLRSKLEPFGIVVDDVALANVNFNEEYNKAIQDKQIQELRVQTEKNILEQKKIQAQQAQIAAQGEANAAIERAKGIAEANRLIAESLTETVLLNNYIDKLSDNVQIMLVPGGQEFLLDLKNLVPQAR